MITYCTFPHSEIKNPYLMDSLTVIKPKIPAVNVYFLSICQIKWGVGGTGATEMIQVKYEISGHLFFLVILFLLSAYATAPLWCLGSPASPTSAWFLTHQNRLCLKHLGSLLCGVGQFPLASLVLPVRWTAHSNYDAIGENANVVTFPNNVSVRMWVYF